MIVLQFGISSEVLIGMGYDQVKIFSDVEQFGSYSHLASTLTLVTDQTIYQFEDQNAIEPTWYRTQFWDSTTSTGSGLSDPVEGIPNLGPLGYLSIEFVRGTTDFPNLANLTDEKIAELIFRSETLLSNYGLRHGGFNTGIPHFSVMITIIGRLLLEEIWLRTLPAIRISNASGMTLERIGSYEYRRATQAVIPVKGQSIIDEYFSAEIMDTLRMLVNISPTRIVMHTTHVWNQMAERLDRNGFNIRRWWDGVDEEIFWQQWGNFVRIPGPWGDNYYGSEGSGAWGWGIPQG